MTMLAVTTAIGSGDNDQLGIRIPWYRRICRRSNYKHSGNNQLLAPINHISNRSPSTYYSVLQDGYTCSKGKESTDHNARSEYNCRSRRYRIQVSVPIAVYAVQCTLLDSISLLDTRWNRWLCLIFSDCYSNLRSHNTWSRMINQ